MRSSSALRRLTTQSPRASAARLAWMTASAVAKSSCPPRAASGKALAERAPGELDRVEADGEAAIAGGDLDRAAAGLAD